MATFDETFLANLEGSFAGMNAYRGKGGIGILRKKPKPAVKSDTPKQKEQKVRMQSLIGLYRALKPYLTEAFEKSNPRQNSWDLLTKYNVMSANVFLTTDEVKRGTAILAPVQISQGSLDSDIYMRKLGDRIVTNICVGNLEITEQTTLLEFSNAVQSCNNGRLLDGDALRIYAAHQLPAVKASADQSAAPASVSVRSRLVRLVCNPELAGSDTVGDLVRAGLLASSPAQASDGSTLRFLSFPATDYWMYAIVQTRYTDGDKVAISTQWLFGSNPLLAQYQTAARKDKAMAELGRTCNVDYLAPDYTDEDPIPVTPTLPSGNDPESGSGNTGPTGGGPGTVEAYTITPRVEPDASFGTITMTPSQMPVPAGSQVRLTATPAGGKRLVSWSDGSTEATITVTVTGNQTVTATFSTIATGGGGNGLGSKSEK